VGVERAGECFGADQVLPIDDLESYMNSLPSRTTFFYNDVITENIIAKVMRVAFSGNNKIQNGAPFVEYLRNVKSEAEINIMKQSGRISGEAFVQVMKKTKEFKVEGQLDAAMEYHCRILGADRLAYPPVVSNGFTNLILHYINNDNVLSDGNLILMDAGGEFHNYNSDITRTWPVNGRFTDPQREVYSEVLEILKKCTARARSDTSIDELDSYGRELIAESLYRLGLLPSKTVSSKVGRFFPHSTSHWLGMDIHDTPSVSTNIQLKPGMIITVEPGIYIPNDDDIPKRFRGIGIRLEDDILITENDPFVLSSSAPKEINDLEGILN